ncbi:MAG: hypothetical protein U0176_16830 [Bacteroidia bacterium]
MKNVADVVSFGQSVAMPMDIDGFPMLGGHAFPGQPQGCRCGLITIFDSGTRRSVTAPDTLEAGNSG